MHWLIIIILSLTEISLAIWLDWRTPHFVLAGLLALGLAGDRIDSLWWIGLGGLLLDVLSGLWLGLHLVLLALIGQTLIWLSQKTFHQPTLLIASLVFLAVSLIYEVVINLVTGALSWQLVGPVMATTALATVAHYLIKIQTSRREIISLV